MICYFLLLLLFKQSNRVVSYTINMSKLFCKVCFDASKADYTSHNVRDSASNVVCPLLLNTKCRQCGYFGHTIRYCKFVGEPVAKKVYVRPARVAPAPIPVVKVPVGAYACLVEDEDDYICRESSPSGVEELDFDKEEIIWGVGFKSMIGKRWADVVGC